VWPQALCRSTCLGELATGLFCWDRRARGSDRGAAEQLAFGAVVTRPARRTRVATPAQAAPKRRFACKHIAGACSAVSLGQGLPR
jgi:hypothetical protein